MSREAVDRAIALGREGYSTGLCSPQSVHFRDRKCCVLGSAALVLGVDKFSTNALSFARGLGMTDNEAWGVMSGWDGNEEMCENEDIYAFETAKRLREEIGNVP